MNFETLFNLAGLLALIGWIPAMFLPAAPFTRNLVHKGWVPGLLAIAYIVLLGTYMGETDGGFSSLSEVKKLFAQDGLLLAGWLHYLAFDLLIGARIGLEAHHKGYSKVWVIPVQAMVFMAGPAGWLVYTIADTFLSGRWSLRKN
jgi:hypothetical protein